VCRRDTTARSFVVKTNADCKGPQRTMVFRKSIMDRYDALAPIINSSNNGAELDYGPRGPQNRDNQLWPVTTHYRRSGMPNFANVVMIEAAPGRRAEILAFLAAHKARCLKDEPGTLQFEILLPKDDDTNILSYEVYLDDAAFETHRNGRSLAQLREDIAGMVVKLHGTRCAVVD